MPDENTPTAELLLIMLENEGNIWRSLEVKSSLIAGTLLHDPFQRFSGWSRSLAGKPGMPRLIWSLTLGNRVMLLLPQFSYSVSHPDSHRALWGLSMTSWATIHKKNLWPFVWTQRNWCCGNWWVWVIGCCGRGCVELRIWCGCRRGWVRSQQDLSPGTDAAQSCCLLCLMGEIEECDCLFSLHGLSGLCWVRLGSKVWKNHFPFSWKLWVSALCHPGYKLGIGKQDPGHLIS